MTKTYTEKVGNKCGRTVCLNITDMRIGLCGGDAITIKKATKRHEPRKNNEEGRDLLSDYVIADKRTQEGKAQRSQNESGETVQKIC